SRERLRRSKETFASSGGGSSASMLQLVAGVIRRRRLQAVVRAEGGVSQRTSRRGPNLGRSRPADRRAHGRFRDMNVMRCRAGAALVALWLLAPDASVRADDGPPAAGDAAKPQPSAAPKRPVD